MISSTFHVVNVMDNYKSLYGELCNHTRQSQMTIDTFAAIIFTIILMTTYEFHCINLDSRLSCVINIHELPGS